MAVRLRLTRTGTKQKPMYRIVATDSRRRRDGGYIEVLGSYNPRSEPGILNLKRERVDYWLAKGARPSLRVRDLMGVAAKTTAS